MSNVVALGLVTAMIGYEAAAMLSRLTVRRIPTITEALVHFVPWWVTIPAAVWLVYHLVKAYSEAGKI